MRCAAAHDVVVYHLGRELDAFLFQDGTHLADVGCCLLLAIDDVELAAAAPHLGIDVVGLACCSQGTTPVVEVRQAELGRYGVVHIAFAQQLAWLCSTAFRVAALYHKVLDAPVEERTVIEAFAGKLEEVLAVQRRIVRKGYTDIA